MISLSNARYFVHANGTMWERALFEHLFFNGPIERIYETIGCYRNPDGGFGHGFEHDIKCPASNPLALEYLLGVLVESAIDPGPLLDGATKWVEQNQTEGGRLLNPPDLLDWPHAPWWKKSDVAGSQGGQDRPDSIVGNLIGFGYRSKTVEARTQFWAQQHLTIEQIHSNDWLFLAYHAFDYFMNVDDFPDVALYRTATVENIVNCAIKHQTDGEVEKLAALFRFAPSPESAVAQALPDGLLDTQLDRLARSQRDDGGWDDEHGLSYWQPYTTISTLIALRNFGRL